MQREGVQVAAGRRRVAHPGVHVADEAAARGMDAAGLAAALGLDVGCVRRLLAGRLPVNADTAGRLAAAFGTSAVFWLRLQADHDRAGGQTPDRPPPGRPGLRPAG